MLERDYIMRLVREFAEALELYLKKDVRKRRDEIQRMYDQYVGPYSFYHVATIDDVMKSMEGFPENERLHRMEMLAELYYVETDLVAGPTRSDLLQKSLALFDFIDRHDRTYDMMRLQKMANIRKAIDQSVEEEKIKKQ